MTEKGKPSYKDYPERALLIRTGAGYTLTPPRIYSCRERFRNKLVVRNIQNEEKNECECSPDQDYLILLRFLTNFAMGRSITALDDLTVNNIGVFKKINEVSLSTAYPESWYTASLKSTDIIVQLAFYSELPVGAIRARSFNNNQIKSSFAEALNSTTLQKTPNCIYIESFAVLEKYRNLGIGSELLAWVINETKNRFIHEIVVHVQASNEKVINWYIKKGFEKRDLVKDYYKEQGLETPDAYILTLLV